MARSKHYFKRYEGHKLYLKELQDTRYGSRGLTKQVMKSKVKYR